MGIVYPKQNSQSSIRCFDKRTSLFSLSRCLRPGRAQRVAVHVLSGRSPNPLSAEGNGVAKALASFHRQKNTTKENSLGGVRAFYAKYAQQMLSFFVHKKQKFSHIKSGIMPILKWYISKIHIIFQSFCAKTVACPKKNKENSIEKCVIFCYNI